LEIQQFLQDNRNLSHWEELPNQDDFPILFYGVESKDMRDGESVSFYNPLECIQICNLIDKLVSSKKSYASIHDIAVIAPYKDQVQKIRTMLRTKNLGSIRVGTVEDHQCQEENIIFISTVRSEQRWLAFDKKHSLGFINNPKAFNEALTRAKSMLVVVGNPFVLIQDPLWKAFLIYCVKNNGYKGVSIDNVLSKSTHPSPERPRKKDSNQQQNSSDQIIEDEVKDNTEDALAEWATLGSGEPMDEDDFATAYMDEKEWRISI